MVKGCNDSVRRHWGEINVMGEVSKPLYGPKWPMGPVLNSGFLVLVHRRVTPSTFAGTHLYTRVKRSTVRVKHLA